MNARSARRGGQAMLPATLGAIGSLWVATQASAADFVWQGNAAIRAYADYCDPTYFDANKILDGYHDPDMAEGFGRALLTRYNADCNAFLIGEVEPYLLAAEMAPGMSESQQQGERTLTPDQARFIGVLQQLLHLISLAECSGYEEFIEQLNVPGLVQRMVGDDILDNARGRVAVVAQLGEMPPEYLCPAVQRPLLEVVLQGIAMGLISQEVLQQR